MSHLNKIYTVCNFSYFLSLVLKEFRCIGIHACFSCNFYKWKQLFWIPVCSLWLANSFKMGSTLKGKNSQEMI